MEVQSLHFSTMVYCEKLGRTGPKGSLRMSGGFMEPKKLQVFVSARLQPAKWSWRRMVPMEVACSYNNVPVNYLQKRRLPQHFFWGQDVPQTKSLTSNTIWWIIYMENHYVAYEKGQYSYQRILEISFYRASILESESFHSPLDEELILKSKSQEIEPYLNGRCIYLVGMMGSGKTTVGKILSQVLCYSFFDSDSLVEEEVDGTSVADIFKHYGEAFFRDKETEVLRKLSMMHGHVISTGGGAVVRPINWKYMHQGISVWLDVPIEALARRITTVGTNSRPLLHYDKGDAYKGTLMRLSALFDERSEAYANANARVSLESIAAKLGQRDVSGLSPTFIAIEALEQIRGFLKGEDCC